MDFKILLYITVFVLSISGYSILKKYNDPEGNLIEEEFTYSHVNNPDDGFLNNPRMANIAVLHDAKGKKFSFQGWPLRHIQENLKSGDKITLSWFNACHKLIARRSPTCINVLGYDEKSIGKGLEIYFESKEWSLIFHTFFAAAILTILWVSYFTKGRP